MDTIHKVAIIKNESGQDIIVMCQPVDSIDDETLFYGPKFTVNAHSIKDYTDGGYFDTLKFYFFDDQVTYRRIANGKIKNIAKETFLRKIIITEDSLKQNDSITFK
jgi:hypothetical protein